jgi:hypothetical protein
MTALRTPLLATLLLALPLLAAWGDDTGTAPDPSGPSASRPTAVPAAEGEVRSRELYDPMVPAPSTTPWWTSTDRRRGQSVAGSTGSRVSEIELMQ